MLQVLQFLRIVNQFRSFSYRFIENSSEFLIFFGIFVPSDTKFRKISNFDGVGVRDLPKSFKNFGEIPDFPIWGITGCLRPFQGSFTWAAVSTAGMEDAVLAAGVQAGARLGRKKCGLAIATAMRAANMAGVLILQPEPSKPRYVR